MKRIFMIVVFFLGVVGATMAQDAAQLINDANAALKAKDYAKAYGLYSKAMSNPGDMKVDNAINYNIGLAALNSKNYDAAVTYFDKAIAAKVNVGESQQFKGDALAKQNKYAAAVTAYKAAISAGVKNKGKIYFNAAIVAYKGKKYAEASDLFGQAAAANYNGGTAYYYKAVALNKLGKTDEFKTTLEEGLKKYPNSPKLKNGLADIYVREGNSLYQQGAKIVAAANAKVKSKQLKTTSPAYKAQIAKSSSKFKAALDVLQKAKAVDPTNQNANKLIEACKSVL